MISFRNPYKDYENSIKMISSALEMNDKEMFIKAVDNLIEVCNSFPDMKDAHKALAEILSQFDMKNEAKMILLGIGDTKDPVINKMISQLNTSKKNSEKSK